MRVIDPKYGIEVDTQIKMIELARNMANDKGYDLFYLCISGSHVYDWNSKDSDIDLRGVYIAPTRQFLGIGAKNLRPLRKVTEINGIEVDVELRELGQEATLLASGNCNSFENLLVAPKLVSPMQSTKIEDMAFDCMSKGIDLDGKVKQGLYGSYRGMAWQNYKKFIKKDKKGRANPRATVKKYLYVFRGLYAGINVLEEGYIEQDMTSLVSFIPDYPIVNELLEIKQSGLENEPLPSHINSDILEKTIFELFERIYKAYQETAIPELSDKDALKTFEKWLINFRLERLKNG